MLPGKISQPAIAKTKTIGKRVFPSRVSGALAAANAAGTADSADSTGTAAPQRSLTTRDRFKEGGLRLKNNAGGGDCFFYTVITSMESSPERAKCIIDALDELYDSHAIPSAMLEKTGATRVSATGLRVLFAWASTEPLLCITGVVLTMFYELLDHADNSPKDKTLQQDTAYIRKSLDRSGGIDLARLRDNLMDPHCYWADEVAITVMQYFLPVRVVVTMNQPRNRAFENKPMYLDPIQGAVTPEVSICVFHDRRHYQTVESAHLESSIFDMDELEGILGSIDMFIGGEKHLYNSM